MNCGIAFETGYLRVFQYCVSTCACSGCTQHDSCEDSKPELTHWCLCSLHAGIQMSPDEVVGSCDGCRHSIAESTVCTMFMCTYVSSGKFSVLAQRCSRALLHNLHLTSDRCLIFASHLSTGIFPAIAIISRLLCLQKTRGSLKYFLKNALLSFCRNMNSAVPVLYAGWLILQKLFVFLAIFVALPSPHSVGVVPIGEITFLVEFFDNHEQHCCKLQCSSE